MLILRRRPGEAVWIGDDIKVTILTADDGGVRLAVDAPKEIAILREELRNAMQANQDAGASAEAAPPSDLLQALVKLEKTDKKPDKQAAKNEDAKEDKAETGDGRA